MIKVGIELQDDNINRIDLRNPRKGNPGVGGTEFLAVLLAEYLHKHTSDFKVIIFHYSMNYLPENIEDVLISDRESLLKKIEREKIDVFIFSISKDMQWYTALKKRNLCAIAWAHEYPSFKEIAEINRCKQIKRVIFVSKEEYDAYIDNDIINKSSYIFNMVYTGQELRERELSEPIVTYVGSLVKEKGFHILAKSWRKILLLVPNAKLYILGSGRLYDRSAKLGKYQIADEEYERMFMPYLTDSDGRILPSVYFVGIADTKMKEEIFSKTSVGVVNPTGISETFCLSAVEMELAGIPVVTKAKYSLFDTVKNNKTGYLVRNERELVTRISGLLQDKESNLILGNNARKFAIANFTAELIIEQWISEIKEILHDKKVNYMGLYENYWNGFKWLKIGIRFLRINLKMNFLPSFSAIEYTMKQIIHMRKN